MQATIGRLPGIRAASQSVLGGSIKVSAVVGPNLRLSRKVGAGGARVWTHGSGDATKFESLEAEATSRDRSRWREDGEERKRTNQEQRKYQSEDGPAR